MYVTDRRERGRGGEETNDNSDGSPDGVGAVTPILYAVVRIYTKVVSLRLVSLILVKLVHYDTRDRYLQTSIYALEWKFQEHFSCLEQ